MISTILTGHKANMLGSIWMIASMAIFAIEDAFVKAASNALPVGQILIIFGLGGAVMFASMARLNNEPLFIKDVVSRPMRIRVVFEIIGRLFYVLAIAVTPLSSATVILQATPLVVVAGAAMGFGADGLQSLLVWLASSLLFSPEQIAFQCCRFWQSSA